MNRQELLESYTMEQLADMVIALNITISDMKSTEKIIKQYNGKKCDCGKEDEINRLKEQVEMFKTRNERIDNIVGKLFENSSICAIFEDELEKMVNRWICETDKLKTELQHKENTINKIDDILKELFGVTHGTDKEPDELKKVLKVFINAVATPINQMFPTEPIKVADILISASKKKINCMTEKEYDKYIFEKWQLRQIAEHLLIYCNANESEDN